MTGRPSSITDESQEKMLLALRGGNFRIVAATWAGIAERTFFEWMKLGKEKPKSKYGAFRRRVLEAEKAAEAAAVAVVLKAGKEDAKHMEWFLERKFPERWGRRAKQQVEVSGNAAGPLVVRVHKYAAEEDDNAEQVTSTGETDGSGSA